MSGAFQIAGLYAIGSVLWILFSDGILWALVQNADTVAALQTTKGIAFVVSSAALIYFLTHRALSHAAATEIQLAKNESRMRAIMRLSGIGIWEDNCGHAPDYLSSQMYAILGYEPLPSGQGFAFLASLRHPEDTEMVDSALEALGTPGNDDCVQTFRMRHRDGDYRWIECRAHVASRDEQGRPERILGSHTDISTLRTAQSERAEERRRLRRLMNNLPGAAYRCLNDENWTMEFLSAGITALTGYSPAMLQNNRKLSYNDIIHPDDQAIVRRAVAQGQSTKSPFEMTYRITARDGSIRWIWERGIFLADGDKPEIMEGFLCDVTESVLGEADLIASERRYHKLFESMITGYVRLRAIRNENGEVHDFLIREFNPAFLELTGLDQQEFEGKPLREVFGTVEEVWSSMLLRVCNGGEPEHFTAHSQYLDRHLEAMAYRVADDEICVILQDVTERTANLRALEASEERLNEAQRIAGVGNFAYNLSTDETYWSPQMFVNYGYPADQPPPTGKEWRQGIHEDDRKRLLAAIARAQQDRMPIDITYRYCPANGPVRFMRGRAEVGFNADGSAETLYGTVQDVSQIEEATRALRESRETLELAIGATGAGSWDIQFDPKQSFTVTHFHLSPRAKALVGYEDDELESSVEAWLALIHRADLAKAASFVLDEFSGGNDDFKFEFRIMHRDGKFRWLTVHGKLSRSDLNTPLRWTGLLWDETERKEIERELAQSRARLDSIVRSAPVGLSLVKDRTVVWVSPVFCDILGRKESEVLGHGTREFYTTDEEHQRVGKALYGQLDQKNVASTESDLYLPDGTCRHVLFHATRFDPDDKESPVTVTGLDISDLEEARLGQLQSEARYRHLFDAAHDAIFLLKDRKAVELNAEAINLLGRPAEEIIGRSPLDFAPELQDDGTTSSTVAHDRMTRALEGLRQTFEWNYLGLDARPRNAEISLSRLEEPFSNWLLIIARDITERKVAEARMRQLTLAVSQSPVGVIITDADGHIEYVNPSFESITGWKLREIIGNNPRFLSAGRTAAKTYRTLWDQIARGKIWRGNFENQRKDGSTYHVSATIAPLRDDLGQITHYIGIQEDVTDQRSAELRQRELEKQFRQTQKMEAIGTLAGGIAHDFNNILAAILGYSELSLSALDPSSDTYSDMRDIHQAGLRARDLVQQILTFSRLSEHTRQPVRVDLIFKETLKLLRSANTSSVEIRQEFEDVTECVLADSTQMHQLVLNLGTNAFQAIGENAGTVTVGYRSCELDGTLLESNPDLTPGKYVCLSVRDTGCGMDPEILDRIFDPFFTTKEQGKGTGLGLATAHGIVKAHGGCIDVSSVVGKGTTFDVYLPCVEAEAYLDGSLATEIVRGSERILVVDDEGALAKLTKRRLTGLGYRATSCDTSAEALKLFTKKPDKFDLILTDQQMPGMNGIELARACWEIRPDIPIIVTSGYSEVLSHTRAREIGFAAFLPKPVALGELADHIRTALDAKRV